MGKGRRRKFDKELGGLDIRNMSEEEYSAYKEREFKRLGVEAAGEVTNEEFKEIYDGIMNKVDEALEHIDEEPLSPFYQEWEDAWNRAKTMEEKYEVDLKYRAIKEEMEKNGELD